VSNIRDSSTFTALLSVQAVRHRKRFLEAFGKVDHWLPFLAKQSAMTSDAMGIIPAAFMAEATIPTLHRAREEHAAHHRS
jgi:hypothetical protein